MPNYNTPQSPTPDMHLGDPSSINASFAHPTPGRLTVLNRTDAGVNLAHSVTGETFTMPTTMFDRQSARESEENGLGVQSVAKPVGEIALFGENIQPKVAETDEGLRRREEIFKPLAVYGKPEDVEETSGRFSDLFTISDEESERRQIEYLAKKQQEQSLKYWPVTAETTAAAIDVLQRVRINGATGLNSIIAEFANRGVFKFNDSPAIVEAIRLNPDVRLAVGTALLERVNDISFKLPERVRKNGGKSLTRNAVGISDLTSREVVALMALAKLDGTFDMTAVRSTDMPDHSRASGQDSQGQHGQAANIILGLPIQ